jgi:N-acetylneuraminic acid mutarotase
VLIAGGTNGTAAQRSIFRFRPATGQVKRIGVLPRPLTHAAAAGLGGRLYVLGGRGSVLNSVTSAIWAVDPASGKVSAAGRLPTAVSDLAAVTASNRILVLGGRTAAGRVTDQILATGPAR